MSEQTASWHDDLVGVDFSRPYSMDTPAGQPAPRAAPAQRAGKSAAALHRLREQQLPPQTHTLAQQEPEVAYVRTLDADARYRAAVAAGDVVDLTDEKKH